MSQDPNQTTSSNLNFEKAIELETILKGWRTLDDLTLVKILFQLRKLYSVEILREARISQNETLFDLLMIVRQYEQLPETETVENLPEGKLVAYAKTLKAQLAMLTL